jgi:hypothetical protein
MNPANRSAPAARRHRGWRAIGALALVAVLGLAFWGYTTPEMQIHCGF